MISIKGLYDGKNIEFLAPVLVDEFEESILRKALALDTIRKPGARPRAKNTRKAD